MDAEKDTGYQAPTTPVATLLDRARAARDAEDAAAMANIDRYHEVDRGQVAKALSRLLGQRIDWYNLEPGYMDSATGLPLMQTPAAMRHLRWQIEVEGVRLSGYVSEDNGPANGGIVLTGTSRVTTEVWVVRSARWVPVATLAQLARTWDDDMKDGAGW